MTDLPDIKDLLVTLDIGTSKITVLVGEVSYPDAEKNHEQTSSPLINIIAISEIPVRGLKRGIVTHIESITNAIEHALAEAEELGRCQIHDVFVTIGGHHIQSFESHGLIALKTNEVHIEDVEQLIEIAKTMSLPSEQKILHVLTDQFILDGYSDIKDPVGMKGSRLEVKVNVITGQQTAVQNLLECLHRCHLRENDIVIQGIASSYAVLTEDDKENGVCLLDIGAGTTDIVVYAQGSIKYTAVIPVAGDHITNDISVALTIGHKEAEQIKLKHGCCLLEFVSPNEVIYLNHTIYGHAQEVSMYRQNLVSVIEPRVDELLHIVNTMLEDHELKHLVNNGIVLTGGTSLLSGIQELSECIFDLPVRLGVPRYHGNNKDIVNLPQHSASYGLLIRALEYYQHQQLAQHHHQPMSNNKLFDLFFSVKEWFKRNF